jgi:cobalt-zinc-cadmium efflux system protein
VSAYLRQLPGVVQLHDLHIWPVSTTETALTCHLVIPGGHPGS